MSLKINKSELKIAIYLIPFFTLALGLKWPILGVIVNLGRYLVIFILAISLLAGKKYKRLFTEKVFISLLLFYTIIIISTLVNRENVLNALQLSMYGIIPFFVFYNFQNDKIIGGIDIAFTVLILINGLIMLLFPEGIYQTYSSNTVTQYYLFGAKNQMVAPLFSGICFFIENAYIKYGEINLKCMLKSAICIAELIVGGSGTGIAAIIFLFIVIIYQNIKKRNVNSKISLLLVPMVFVSIVLLRLQNLFAFFIEGVLGKSLDSRL